MLHLGDCQAIYEQGWLSSGSYDTYIGAGIESIYCEMSESEQWTIIQQRAAGDIDFYRNYSQYQEGFGTLSADTDFW